MRVLYKPDEYVFVCPRDATTIAVGIDEVRFDDNFVYYRESMFKSVSCPICHRPFREKDKRIPEVDLKAITGKCSYCGSSHAQGDKVCPNCGHTL